MVVTAWNLHVGPEMGERFRAGGVAGMRRHLVRVRLSYLVAAVLPGGVVLLGLPLVGWIVGPEFGAAILFVPFLLFAILPDALYFADVQIVYYSGRSSWIGAATVTAALLNVSLGLVLIPAFGAYGAIAARLGGALLRSAITTRIAGGTKGPKA